MSVLKLFQFIVIALTLALALQLSSTSAISNPAQPRPQTRVDEHPLPTEGTLDWVEREHNLARQAAVRAFWNEAAYRWMKILRYYPDWAHIWNNLAISMEALGEWERAESYYRTALHLQPKNEDIRANFLRFKSIQERYLKSREKSSPELLKPEKKRSETEIDE